MRTKEVLSQKLTGVGRLAGLFFILFFGFGLAGVQAAVITSITDNDWDQTSTWDGGVVPGIDDTVIISSNNFVVVMANAQAKMVIVEVNSAAHNTNLSVWSGVTLTILGNLHLNSNDDGAVQVRVRGTLTVHGDIHFNATDASKAQINMNYSNNPTLNMRGDFVLNSEGKLTVNAANPSTVHLNGTNPQTLLSASDIRYYHIRVNNSSGTGVALNGNLQDSTKVLGRITIERGTFDNAGYSVSGSDSLFEVRNNCTLLLRNSSGLPLDFLHQFNPGSTVEFNGNQEIFMPNNSQTYQNVMISGTGTKTLGEDILISGNLTLQSGGLNMAPGTHTLTLNGNWVYDGGAFSPDTGLVILAGSQEQNVGGLVQTTFYRLEINNSSSTGIRLGNTININEELMFNTGYIFTESEFVVINNPDQGGIKGHNANSYIVGNMRQAIAENNVTYPFPLGYGSPQTYHLAELINHELTGINFIDAKFDSLRHHDDADLNVSDSIDYIMIKPEGVWFLDPDGDVGSGSYDIRLYITNFSGIVDNGFAPLKRPSSSMSGADWTHANGTLNAYNGLGRRASHGYGLRMGLTDFSQFGIGSSGSLMPVELLSFSAALNEAGKVDLTWTSLVEVNNHFFEVERSSNGVNYEVIGKKAGHGNSQTIHHYQLTDHNPIAGAGYYRLRQVDFDETASYSSVVSVFRTTVSVSGGLQIYPVPATAGQSLYLNLAGFGNSLPENPLSYEIFDMAGKRVSSGTLPSLNHQAISLPENLVPGNYLLTGRNRGQAFSGKFSVK